MSRIAFISDIHANIDALEEVLKGIDAQGISEIFCLGDIVGYGASPAECIELVRTHCSVTVLGNHDHMVIEKGPIIGLERVAAPLRLAREQLSTEQIKWLKKLPIVVEREALTLVHSSLYEPKDFNYITAKDDAKWHFEHQRTPFSFIGHTHSPLIAIQNESGVTLETPGVGAFKLDPSLRYIINVGSVGQPRDNYPRACYGILDTERLTFSWKRVPYDIKRAQQRIRDAGLPWANASRLDIGY
jgi:diadenosine tetraphosphatase ApaH/serine/threonine PP2A family protein phosphatase